MVCVALPSADARSAVAASTAAFTARGAAAGDQHADAFAIADGYAIADIGRS
jgi:hypothetical protein